MIDLAAIPRYQTKISQLQMKRINKLLYVLAFISIGCYGQDNYKNVEVCQGKLSLEVPSGWKYRNDYKHFSNYEIKSDEMLFYPQDSSMVMVNVFDSMYRKKVVVDNERLEFEREQDSLLYKRIKFIETGFRKIGNLNMGYLKFRVTFPNGKVFYIIQSFFKDSLNFYYEIQISNFKKPDTYFKPIADRIFGSLNFKPG